jgi:hypothetical protein
MIARDPGSRVAITVQVPHLARITFGNLFGWALINGLAVWWFGNRAAGEWSENPRNIQSLASLFEKSAGGVPLIVIDLTIPLKFELLYNYIDAFEFGKIRNDMRLNVYRAKSSRSYKPGRARTNAFDRPRFKGCFLDEDTGKGSVRHNSPLVRREENDIDLRCRVEDEA